MKSNLITLAFSSAIFTAVLLARQTVFSGTSSHGRYYVTTILMISGILSVITLIRLIRSQRNRSISDKSSVEKASRQHRSHYRVRFDRPPLPIFIQKIDDSQPGPAFTCPVHDISETGICLDCTGEYMKGQSVQGEIIFDSGRTAPVNGVVIREEMDRTSLRLHCPIDPPLLMAEQRDRISNEKATGPRPAVSQTILEKSAGALPSHSPKGICRLK